MILPNSVQALKRLHSRFRSRGGAYAQLMAPESCVRFNELGQTILEPNGCVDQPIVELTCDAAQTLMTVDLDCRGGVLARWRAWWRCHQIHRASADKVMLFQSPTVNRSATCVLITREHEADQRQSMSAVVWLALRAGALSDGALLVWPLPGRLLLLGLDHQMPCLLRWMHPRNEHEAAEAVLHTLRHLQQSSQSYRLYGLGDTRALESALLRADAEFVLDPMLPKRSSLRYFDHQSPPVVVRALALWLGVSLLALAAQGTRLFITWREYEHAAAVLNEAIERDRTEQRRLRQDAEHHVESFEAALQTLEQIEPVRTVARPAVQALVELAESVPLDVRLESLQWQPAPHEAQSTDAEAFWRHALEELSQSGLLMRHRAVVDQRTLSPMEPAHVDTFLTLIIVRYQLDESLSLRDAIQRAHSLQQHWSSHQHVERLIALNDPADSSGEVVLGMVWRQGEEPL